jgi:predicted ABC-type ATPase
MFAGPNGSGKSTIRSLVPAPLLGVYINPDEIEAELSRFGTLSFRQFGITPSHEEVGTFLRGSRLLRSAGLDNAAIACRVCEDSISLPAEHINSYVASVLADFIRQSLLSRLASFTFETVMSSVDKVDLLTRARASLYRTYLYYIATDDPEINVLRVSNRVRLGGHPVPVDKIHARYYRSLALLPEAIPQSNRAYLFDNSGREPVWIAEITNGVDIHLKTDRVPRWVQRTLAAMRSA